MPTDTDIVLLCEQTEVQPTQTVICNEGVNQNINEICLHYYSYLIENINKDGG